MNKEINIELNKFPTIPNDLRNQPSINTPVSEFNVDLCRLYHHYYFDSYGQCPPNPNHGNFEYLKFLSSSNDFRFLGNGPGASTSKKRTISQDLGQAFCRYFLYEFLGINYFAHMDKVLNKKTHPAFCGMEIKRISKGDVPDYLCARSATKPYIGEAKGRFSKIKFISKEFDKWRDQFSRIEVLDKHKIRKRVKGYIVGTQFATEVRLKNAKSGVFAEDPETVGEEPIGDNQFGIGRGTIAIHYSRIMSKLGLNLFSSSLDLGFEVSEQLTYNLPIWRCNFGPLNGVRFVGGFISDSEPNLREIDNKRVIYNPNILRLDFSSPLFIGLKRETFREISNAARGNWEQLDSLSQLEDTNFRPSNLAWLRDGSVSGALDFFEFDGLESF